MVTFSFVEIKDITSHIFIKDTFDSFLLYEAEFVTGTSFSIDGALNKAFFDSDELELIRDDFIRWADIKPICFNIIKGKKLPLSFKLTFKLSYANTERFIKQTGIQLTADELNGLFINLRYVNNKLTATTGTSTRNFTLDRSYEKAWDEMIFKFFKQKEILIESL
ncbi:MAG: hypothetical protein IJM37_05090 [Lachnospiraceae bacterium]|nr:hypothetical protein [Lachnospiraceae bacterium]